jgi:hypothetical protein
VARWTNVVSLHTPHFSSSFVIKEEKNKIQSQCIKILKRIPGVPPPADVRKEEKIDEDFFDFLINFFFFFLGGGENWNRYTSR